MKRMLSLLAGALAWAGAVGDAPAAGLRAGAHSIDVSPRKLPAIRNGGFLEEDLYNEEQRAAIAKARADDNNRANRGAD